MISIRLLTLVEVTCVIPALISCAQIESVDRQVEQELAEHHTSCLSTERPAYSPQHTDCVLSRRQERQRQLERMRNVVAPPPPAMPEVARRRDD